MNTLCEGFPKALMSTTAASLIVDEETSVDILKAMFLYSTLETKRLNPDLGKKTFDEVAKQASMYVRVAPSSKLIPSAQRTAIIKKELRSLFDFNGNAIESI